MGFGIRTRLSIDGVYTDAYACSCGNKYTADVGTKCNICDNTCFIRVYSGRINGKVEDVNFEIVREDISGFVAKRYIDNYSYSSDVELSLEHKSTTGFYYMIVDFKHKQFYFKDGKDNILPFTSGRIQYFLKKIDNVDYFIKSFKTSQLKELMNSVEYLYRTRNGWGYSSFPKGFEKFINGYEVFSSYQVLANCGFDSSFIKKCIDNRPNINLGKTKPHEILGVSKSSLRLIRDFELNFKHIESIKTMEELGIDKVRYVYEKVKDECGNTNASNLFDKSEDYVLMINKYNYDNKRLVNYLTREVKLQQGIDNPGEALTLLKDTNKMCEDMQVEMNEKYPKSLKKDHDIAKLNYKINLDSITQRRFDEATNKNEYKNLIFKDKKYTVMSPKASNDLIKEGDSLSHCVSSYIKDVCDSRCKIYFIRDVEDKETPLLTVEVRGDRIIQVRGKFNRSPVEEEKQFINKWAISKNIKLNY